MTKKWKIEGKDCARINAIRERMIDIAKQSKKVLEDLQAQQEAAHKELWEAVYTTLPEVGAERERSYTLDTEHADAGVMFVLLKDKKKSSSGGGFLEKLLGLDKEEEEERPSDAVVH